MAETTEGSCLTERTKKEKSVSAGPEADFSIQTRQEDGEQAGAKAGCWGDVGTYRKKWSGAHPFHKPTDGQAKAKPIFLKRLQCCINAESVLLLEEANIKDRQALWKKSCHFRVRLLSGSVRTSTLDSNHQELFPKPVQGLSGAQSARARLSVVGQVGCHAMLCYPMHEAAGEGPQGAAPQPAPP